MIRDDPPPDSPPRGRTEPPDGRVRPRRVDSAILRAGAQPVERAEGGRLGELFQQHGDGAIRLAYLLTGDRALAEDLVQDAFVKVAGRLVHLREAGAFDAYLRRTVVNLSRSNLRRKKLERQFLQRERGVRPVAAAGPGRGSIEDRDELWTAMGGLSERQRAALVLRFYEDLS